MNIILITTGIRGELLSQAIDSYVKNSADRDRHHLTIVQDGFFDRGIDCFSLDSELMECNRLIVNPAAQGASRSRNIGAASIPKYLRHEHVMFCDDDVYFCPGWDSTMEHVSNFFVPGRVIVSGYAHPYNRTVIRDSRDYYTTNVISSVQMFMSWELWDDVGFFSEPGGAGGSEDVEYCQRATEKNYSLAISKPQCAIHTGLSSSKGDKIVGHDLLVEQNKQLEMILSLNGKIIYS